MFISELVRHYVLKKRLLPLLESVEEADVFYMTQNPQSI